MSGFAKGESWHLCTQTAKGKAMKLIYTLLLESYWLLLRCTIKLRTRGLELVEQELLSGRTPVFALPHHTILLSALAYAGRDATLLASLSKDGEFAANFLRRRGFRLVRGSSSRGGKEALTQLEVALREGRPVAITFDGPRGPRLVAKPGVALCGWQATGSIFLLKHRLLPTSLLGREMCLKLRSWDRFVLPLPGCCFECEFEPVQMPDKNTCSREDWVSLALQKINDQSVNFYDEARTSVTKPCST